MRVLSFVTLLAGCAAMPRPVHVATPAPAADAVVRLGLVGDTGELGASRDRVMAAMAAADLDGVVVAGDLVYPSGPACKTLTPAAESLLDERIGTPFSAVDAPIYLALGNHDVAQFRRAPKRESCYLAYAAQRDALLLPALTYTVDLGPAMLAVLNTNALNRASADHVREAFAGHAGWHLTAGHHGLTIYHDKDGQAKVKNWLNAHELRPDAHLNGHAHLLQYGVYDGIAAITSGAGAKLRERPGCSEDLSIDCGEGQLWGVSTYGFAVLTLSADAAEVAYYDADGAVLYSAPLSRTR